MKKIRLNLKTAMIGTALTLFAITASVIVRSAGAPPNIPPVWLSSDPLYSTSTGDKPALALALSVEYPTVGAQYVQSGALDQSYNNSNEYLGYYDAEACYAYNNTPNETPDAGLSISDYKRFDRVGAALPLTQPDAAQPTKTSRKCADAFSGNFLNWASSSAIDMLRLSLSGGDRYIDTPALTVLQRAVIPNGDPTCMWNTSNFPAKRLQRNDASGGNFWGAVPLKMATAAGADDIYVANTLDRIYFRAGSGPVGGCGGAQPGYQLAGMAVGGAEIGPITTGNSLPAGMTQCAVENSNCSVSGVQEIWYGAPNAWKVAPAKGTVACSNAVFGDPIFNTAKRCYVRNYTGNWTPPSDNQLNTDGYFFARVSVCDKSNGGALQDIRDYGLCTRYPSGNFKPTGAIQKYSDQLRIAAFGYALDQTQSAQGGRYGGVLRAPMKFVGARTFDIFGQDNTPAGGNPVAEWDAFTGVFASNPDNDTTQNPQISGVVNYLNKFGRTGTKGRYKIYDPVGELYYQTLRYLQGLQPEAASVANLTPAMYDGFPLSTTWQDPYGDGRSSSGNYSCLKSNIVMIGDVNSWDGNRLPQPSASGNVPDINYWTSVVGKFERNQLATYLDGDNQPRTTGNPNGGNGNVRGNQIIGSAYWAHTHDIRGADWTAAPALQRPGLRVKTFIFDVNEYGDGNNLNTRRYGNQFFTAAKYGGYESDPSNPGARPFNTFGNPFKRQDGTNDNNVWQKPADPGEASTYYLQSSARGILSAFDEIFGRAASSARSIAGAATSSSSLQVAVDNVTFQGAFDATDWSGDLLAVPLLVDSNSAVTVGANNYWSASQQLMALGAAANSRNIVIGRAGASANPTATEFTAAAIGASANSSIKDALDRATPASASDGLADDRIAFLRGDRSKESSVFRVRNKLLGDIVNSGIAYSGAPPLGTFSSTYAGFYTANKTRTPVVFVGANDGMLHAFKATLNDPDSGKEVFAFIPSWITGKLPALTAKNYANNHQSFVDGSPTVGEAELGSSGTPSDWKTVLVAGTGAGGRGVFALDVTNPSSFDASKVLWEFTQSDDVDLGYVVGKPKIVKIRTSARGVGPATYKWFAAVPSGVNNYVPDASNRYSATGNPALFLLDLSKPVGQTWILGTNYFKIVLPVDATLSTTMATGLINFSAGLGAFGDVKDMFMGDLHGRVWKLDFDKPNGPGSSGWTMASLTGYSSGSGPMPLFKAIDTNNRVQPITVSPLLARGEGPYTTYVTFGTGKYLEASDKSSPVVNSLYSIYDNSELTSADSGGATSIVKGRSRLQARVFNAATQTTTGASFRWGRPTSDSDMTRRSGWFADFPEPGEREVSEGVVFGNTYVLGALIPATSGSPSACAAPGGSGREWNINIDTGLANTKISVVGVLGKPLVLDVPSTTVNSPYDNTGKQRKTITSVVVQQGSTGLGSSTKLTQEVIIGRLSWRQINNYLDLKAAATP